MTKTRQLKFVEAIKEAIDQSMKKDNSVFIIGEGVPDPKGIFGTTLGLQEKYSDKRVQDMPVSENALTGVCIGAAMTGLRPILTHQRIDFSLLSLDQIINNAAKWHYMFGGKSSVPIVIKIVIGRGWGQGAQHSQNLQALFAHIPGLKVVMPTTAYDAKGLLISSIKDNNPIIFIEHRWLHNIMDFVPKETYQVPIGKANIIRNGKDLTIVSTSYMTLEAVRISDLLSQYGVSIEIVDVRTLKPLDNDLILNSVKKTGHVIVMDTGYNFCGFAAEIVSIVSENLFHELKSPPERITLPDIPTPTSRGLTKYYYPNMVNIAKKILIKLNKTDKKEEIIAKIKKQTESIPHDIPDKSFTGPF